MNKLIVLCLLCGLPLLAQSLRISGDDFHHNVIDVSDVEVEDMTSPEQDQDQDQDTAKTSMIEDCFIKILTPSVNCIMNTLSQWDVNVDQLKYAVNHKPTCCATWQITDCLINKAKVYCNAEENIEFNIHMNEMTSMRNRYNCSQIQYQWNTCRESAEEVPAEPRDQVITDVEVRDGKEEESRVNDQTVDEVAVEDKPVEKTENQLSLSDLGEFKLAQRLLDRVNRITIQKVVIDLHPVKSHHGGGQAKTHETDTFNRVDSYIEP